MNSMYQHQFQIAVSNDGVSRLQLLQSLHVVHELAQTEIDDAAVDEAHVKQVAEVRRDCESA